MKDETMSLIVALWFVVVISTITLFVLLKIGGWMFNFQQGGQTYQQQMYHLCLRESNGTAGSQCAYVLKAVH